MIDVALRGLPGVVAAPRERGHVAFEVAGRAFALLDEDAGTLVVKASREEQAALAAAEPGVYGASHVSGRFGWVAVRLAGVGVDELRELVVEAWRLSAPARLVTEWERE